MILHHKKIGQGPALLVLHGLLGSGDNWQSLARKWSERYTVYLLDARNHGHSEHSSEFTFYAMVKDLQDFMLAENLDSAHILGHSMGGKTAMHFAQQFPEMIKKLVVVDMGIKAYAPHHQDILEALNSVDFDQHRSREAVDEQLAKHINQASVRLFLMKNLYWAEKGILAWRFNLNVISENYNAILGAVEGNAYRGPALFVRGMQSNYILDKDWSGILSLFPSAQLLTIPDAGHWVHAEAPDKMLSAVEDFLG